MQQLGLERKAMSPRGHDLAFACSAPNKPRHTKPHWQVWAFRLQAAFDPDGAVARWPDAHHAATAACRAMTSTPGSIRLSCPKQFPTSRKGAHWRQPNSSWNMFRRHSSWMPRSHLCMDGGRRLRVRPRQHARPALSPNGSQGDRGRHRHAYESCSLDAEDEPFTEVLLYRSQRQLGRVDRNARMEEPGTVFIAVGAGHLAGDTQRAGLSC